MSRLVDILRACAWCALTALCIVLTITVVEVAPRLLATLELANRTIGEAGEAVTNLRDASRAWNKNSDAQAKAILEAEKQTTKTMSDFDELISHTDTQLNGQVLPQLANAISHQDAALEDTERQVATATATFSRDSSAMLVQTTTLIRQLSQDATDPAIKESLQRVAASLEQVQGMATDGHTMTTMTVEQLKKLYAPKRLAVELFQRLLGFAGPAAQIATAARK